MDKISALTTIDYTTVILWVFAILFGIKEILELKTYFKKRYGIKTNVDTENEAIEKRITTLESHDKWQYKEITNISTGVAEIHSQLEEMVLKDNEKTIATLRNQLYDLHNKFMAQEFVDKSGLKTFLDLGKIYEAAGGNDIYHDKLKPEVMNLQIKDE